MKPLKAIYYSFRRSQSGNAILPVLISLAVIFTSYSFLTNSVVDYKKKVISVKNDLDLRLALHSTMDFIIFGIKQQYCFDEVFMQDAKCDLAHPASVERLIMTTDQLNYIKSMIESGAIKEITKPEDAMLDKINQNMKFSAASTAHPLYIIFSQKELNEIADGIDITIERDRSLFLPTFGSEIYLNIKVAFSGIKSKALNKWNKNKFALVSKVSIHPRELGSFALLLPRDLRLDKSYNSTLAVGDVSLHQFVTTVEEVKKYKGLTFLSPVFVNQNIHLPAAKGPHFTPVTFADKVYMGNGTLYKEGAAYKPNSTGSIDDRYWVGSGEGFGGFLKGVENDGGLDKGLSVFGKVSASVPVDYALMQSCIARSQGNVNNEIVFQNVMAVETKKFNRTGSKLDAEYKLILSNGDEFTYQGDKLANDAKSNGWGDLSDNKNSIKDYNFYRKSTSNYGTLLTTEVTLDSTKNNPNGTLKTVSFDMSTDYKDASKDEYVELQIQNSEGYLKSVDNQIKDIDLKIVNSTNDLKNILSALVAVPALSKEDADKKKEEQIQKEKEVSLLKAQKVSLENDKANAGSMASKPGKIKLFINNSYNKYDSRENDRLNLNMLIENEKSIVDDKGNPFEISVKTQGWNLGYYRKKSTYKDNNGVVANNLNLTNDFTLVADKSSGLYSFPSHSQPVSATANTFDYAAFDALCEEKRNAQTSQSFGSAGYNIDFSPTTRASWNFSGAATAAPGADPALSTLTFDATNASTPANSTFQVRSIVGNCIIGSGATFVTGFLSCDTLTINSRTQPLRIIATIIAGRLNIHPDALKAGIVWSSVYHPQATYELRKMSILRPVFGAKETTCNEVSALNEDNPIWHPKPSIQYYSNRNNCNVISLRAKADPFRWTTVDPDCGLVSGNSNTICKHKLNRFFLFEHSRGAE